MIACMCANAEVSGRKHGVFQNFEEKKMFFLTFLRKFLYLKMEVFFFFLVIQKNRFENWKDLDSFLYFRDVNF